MLPACCYQRVGDTPNIVKEKHMSSSNILPFRGPRHAYRPHGADQLVKTIRDATFTLTQSGARQLAYEVLMGEVRDLRLEQQYMPDQPERLGPLAS